MGTDPPEAPQHGLRPGANSLGPAERLLDLLAALLRDGVTGMPGDPAFDSLVLDLLRHMGCEPGAPQIVDEVSAVVALVEPRRGTSTVNWLDSSCVSSSRTASQCTAFPSRRPEDKSVTGKGSSDRLPFMPRSHAETQFWLCAMPDRTDGGATRTDGMTLEFLRNPRLISRISRSDGWIAA